MKIKIGKDYIVDAMYENDIEGEGLITVDRLGEYVDGKVLHYNNGYYYTDIDIKEDESNNSNEISLGRHTEVLKLLAITDNEVTRHLEGNPSSTWSNFDELKAQRELWRSEINEIEESLGMKWNPLTNQFEGGDETL